MQRAIEIAEKIVAEFRALANMHAAESQGYAEEAVRTFRMSIAHDCGSQADGAEIVLNALRAEAERQANHIPGEE